MSRTAAAAVRAAPSEDAGAARRPRLTVMSGEGAILSLGTVASGVLAYAFNAIAARTLGPADYGPIAILWALVFLMSVVLFRPLEQTLARGIADRLARGEDTRCVIRAAGRLGIGVTVVATLGILAAWSPLTNGLFGGRDALTAALALGVIGYCASFAMRGLLSGVRWLAGYGLLLLADGVARFVLVLPLVFFASPTLAAVAIAVAAFAGVLAPLAGRGRPRLRPALTDGSGDSPFELRHALRFAAPVGVVAAADQILVSGGALLVAFEGGEEAAVAAGTVFAATMLVRAPVFLFQGFAAALLPNLTRLQALGDAARFRLAILRAVGVLSAFAVALTAGMLIAGPESMRLLYGPSFDVARSDLAILAAGVGAYLAAATFSQASLARDLARQAAWMWSLASAAFVAVFLLLPGVPMHRVSVAFCASALLAATGLLALLGRSEATPLRVVPAPQT